MNILPNKLSDLLELAVRDVQKCEAEPTRFRIDMGRWHTPLLSGTCAVCMAGAVLAQTIGVADGQYVAWKRIVEQAQLVAINELRTGDFVDAAHTLDIVVEGLAQGQQDALDDAANLVRDSLPPLSEDEEQPDEAPDFHAPWDTYLKAASILRGAGL